VNFDEFFRQAGELNIRMRSGSDSDESYRTPLLSNEALFQLPFLAMVILVVSKGTRKPAMAEVGRLVGECLQRTLVGFKGSSQDIGWSANLRIRTVKALTFLEVSRLAEVNARSKTISVTERGRAVLNFAMREGNSGNLADTLRVIERNYRNISAEAQIKLELS